MTSKMIKRIAGISAIGLAGVLVVGTILNTVMSVEAQETLFGIETLMQEVQSRQTPYRILEIVPDEAAAEIGYYVPGCEPVLSERQADSGKWVSWEEGLKQFKTLEERREYVENLNQELQEFYTIRGFSNAVPVTYREYTERQTAAEGYKELVFDEEKRKGFFRTYVPGSGAERYRLEFYYAGNATDDEFQGLIDKQYYYVKTATKITVDDFDDLDDNDVLYRAIYHSVTSHFEEVGTWGELKDSLQGTVSGNNSSVSGNGSVTDGNAGSGINPGDIPEYYRLEIERWEQGTIPDDPALYAVQTMIQSDSGEFEFCESVSGYDYSFRTASVYYKGGFINNEWIHTKVLNMQSGQTENFKIEVLTLTPAELNARAELPAFDMLYLNSGMQEFADSETIQPYSAGTVSDGDIVSAGNDISEERCKELFSDVILEAKPCIVDAAIIYTTNTQGVIEVSGSLWDTSVFRLAAMFMQTSPNAYYTNNVRGNAGELELSKLVSGIVADTDKNFVTEQTYSFFAPAKLIGPDFGEYNIYDEDGNAVNEERAEGFKAVLDEIVSENLNREADASGEYDLLPINVSQATAVRHIMNYGNRRQIAVKESIRVLEIQPVKSAEDSYDLTAEEIMDWAPGVKEVQIDRMTTAEFIGKIEDINEIYDLVYIGTDRDYLNLVSGVSEVPTTEVNVPNGDGEQWDTVWSGSYEIANPWWKSEYVYAGDCSLKINGMTTQMVEVEPGKHYKLTAYGRVGDGNDRGTMGVFLMRSAQDNTASEIGKVGEVEFKTETYTQKSLTFTAVEGTTHLKIFAWSGRESLYLDNITIEEVDAPERAVGSTVFNDSSMDGLIYFHTGDIRYSAMELAGQLDSEYVNFEEDGRTNDVYYYNPVRYGGNDITYEKKEALLSFLKASYPIIISDEVFESAATVYQHAGWTGYSVNLKPGSYNIAQMKALGIANDDISSIKVSKGYQVTVYSDDYCQGSEKVLRADESFENTGWDGIISSIVVEEIEGQEEYRTRKIDTDHIDNSSFMYEFIEEAMEESSFYARSEMRTDSPMFQFYLNRPKANLVNVVANGKDPSKDVVDIFPQENDKYMLEYKFTIQNKGAASADTRYECKLFIDVNADGKYSESEELGDISITQNGKAVSSTNLYAGREYELRRNVPDEYKGVLPWKIQISQVNNPHIHNGVSGYTKLKGLERATLSILQICRDQVTEVGWFGGANEVLFNLEKRIADPSDIYYILINGGEYGGVKYEGIKDEFDISVKFMKISEFEAEYAKDPTMMDDYNMLILGFSDAYGNISGNATEGPISGIIEFIESGKSVLFAHDTVSYFNYEKYRQDENGNTVAREGAVSHDDPTNTKLTTQYHNSYNLSKNIRRLVGMDRYGVTTVDRLKTGVGLSSSDKEWSVFEDLKKERAYIPKSGKTETTGLTHGYTYSIINVKDVNTKEGRNESFTADQTGTESFTNTYLNLDYGVVYYSDNFADNGEIKQGYNCEVSNLWVTKVNSGQITDYPYKLNDTFMVSNTHAQYYQLDFMADDDMDGQSDLVVWYCLGHRTNGKGDIQETIYSASPNDVSNNYYIYNKGNITYTGVGHAGNKSTVDEAKLFINTMIASYSAGVKDPVISILDGGSGDSEEISSFNSYYDEENNLQFDSSETTSSGSENMQKLYFSVNDPNFVKGERKISIRCYYETNETTENQITYEGKTVNLKSLPVKVYDATTNQEVENIDNLTSGASYYILFDDSVMENFKTKFSVYFEAQSTITKKGVINNSEYTIQTKKSYNRFDYTGIQLFDLE